jgi:hypothetical protein
MSQNKTDESSKLYGSVRGCCVVETLESQQCEQLLVHSHGMNSSIGFQNIGAYLDLARREAS